MRILLPIDESSCSDAAVETILHEYDPAWTEIYVVHAVERNVGVPPYVAFGEGPSAAESALSTYGPECAHQQTIAAKTVERLHAAGFRATAEVRVGDPVGVILDCSAAWHPDAIVIGSHGRSGLSRLIHGSVAGALRRAAGCDVVVVEPPNSDTIH